MNIFLMVVFGFIAPQRPIFTDSTRVIKLYLCTVSKKVILMYKETKQRCWQRFLERTERVSEELFLSREQQLLSHVLLSISRFKFLASPRGKQLGGVEMSDRNLLIGDVEIVRIVDAIVDYPFPLDEFYPGVPVENWDPWRKEYPTTFATEKTHRLVYTCYVLRSAGQTILVDTGLGPAWAPLAVFWQQTNAARQAFQLLDELQSVGVRPEDVQMVFLTHLHPDHVGWNLLQENGQSRLTFPRARYVLHQAGWEAFHTPEMQALLPFDYIGVHVTPLEHLGALELLIKDSDLAPGIAVIHTPGHMSVVISSKGQNAILVSDAFIHPAQITEPTWDCMFDVDKEMAQQTRRRLLERITADEAIVYVSHFPAPGIGRIVRRDQRYYWHAREE